MAGAEFANFWEAGLQRRTAEATEEGALQKMRAEATPEKPLTAGQVAMKHGLQVKRDGDQIVIWTHYDGQDVEFARATRDAASVQKAEQQIVQLEKDKREALEKKYGVAFSRDDEPVETQIEKLDQCGEFIKNKHVITARAPHLPELLGVEKALESGAPSYITPDGKQGVKFYYLNEKFLATDGADTLANYMQKDKDGRAAVYFWPGSSDGRLITEKDVQRWGSFQESSIAALTEHELGHNSQLRLGWNDSAKLEKMVHDMGWHVYQKPGTCETVWMIRGKKDDEYYRLGEDGFAWNACNAEGALLDPSHTYTADEVRDRARVKPATEYFDNAVEMDADALMMLRTSAERRRLLMRNSRAFYDFVKTQDQADIDVAYGVTKDGTSKKIRLPNGFIVDNNPANRKQVADFESDAAPK